MHQNYNFSSRRTAFRPLGSGTITTEITFFRTTPHPLNRQSISNSYYNDNDERFSIGRPRWVDEEPDSRARNPHQTQQLSQYELTGIPEPDFSHAPWRPDLTASPEDEYEYYLRQYEDDVNYYMNEDYDTFSTHTPPPPRHFRGRLVRHGSSSTSSSSSSRRGTIGYSYSTGIRSVVNARTLRPSYTSSTQYSSSSSNQRNNRSRTIRVTFSTSNPVTPTKKKEEKPKPTVTPTHKKISQKEVDEEQSCSICLEPFKKDETVAVLKCNHFFHEGCIKPWIEEHYTCPICRADITDEKKEKKKKK